MPPASTVLYPSGGKAFYGTTTDSRVTVQGRPDVVLWGVRTVQDLFNNSYEVAYTLDAPNGQLYPATVTYTKAPNITTYRTVEFEYGTRTDTEPGYFNSDLHAAYRQTTKRLTAIAVKSASRLVRRYRLDYECGDSQCASDTGRSRLRAVTEIGSDGVSELKPQSFTYRDGGTGFHDTTHAFVWGASIGKSLRVADFDGDGKTDFLFIDPKGAIRIERSAGDGTFFQWGWKAIPANAASDVVVADFNGDGRPDVLYSPSAGSYQVLLNDGTGQALQWTGPLITNIPGDGLANVIPADFDGDGKADLLKLYDDPTLQDWYHGPKAFVLFGNGDGTFTQRGAEVKVPHSHYVSIGLNCFVPADFDGDGRTDLLVSNESSYWVLFSNGDGSWATGPATGLGGRFGVGAAGIVAADVNGDGKADLFTPYAPYGRQGHGLALGRGDGTFIPQSASIAGNLLPVDVNGDGFTDIVSSTDGYWLSTGDGGFLGPHPVPPSMRGGSERLVGGDFTGDGKPDFLVAGWDGYIEYLGVAIGDGVAPDLLTTVTNGIGGTIGVSYAPAPLVDGAIVPRAAADPAPPGISNAAPQQLVTRVTSYDGRGGAYVTAYGYFDARVVPGRREAQRDLGFASISITDAQTQQKTQNDYVQTPGCEGHVGRVSSYGAMGLLKSVKEFAYRYTADSGTSTELCLEEKQTATSYEKGVPTSTQTTTTAYDQYANPTSKIQDAAAYRGAALPTVTISTQFTNDETNWILGRVLSIRTTSGGRTLGEVKNTWSGNTILAKSEWLDSDNRWLFPTFMTYDANGNVASVEQPIVRKGDGVYRKTTTVFDATFHAYPDVVTNSKGHTTRATYNDEGSITTFKDVNGNVTTTTYDVFGRKKTETRPDGGTTTYTYENYGNPWGYPSGQYMGVETTVASGRTAFKKEYFDGSGFKYQTLATGNCAAGVFTEVQRDAAGRPWRTTLPYCGWQFGATPSWTTTTYDAMGRIESVRTPDDKSTTYAYGVDGSRPFETVTDPNGQTKTRFFDARDKVTAVVDAAGQTTSYGYDALGRLVRVTLPNGDETRQTWDSLSRRTSVTTSSPSDATAKLTPSWKTVDYAYDALNRVTKRQPAGEPAATYVYDETWAANALGRLTTLTDESGVTKFGYTKMGQVAAAMQSYDGGSYTLGYAYDLLQRVTMMSYPDGSHAEYDYADGGQHAGVRLFVGGSPAASATWSDFNAMGKPATLKFNDGAGATTKYTYDVMSHVTSLVATAGKAEVQNLAYDWYQGENTGGLNLGSITDQRANKIAADGSNTSETQAFTYDPLYRLTTARFDWATKSYSYDGMGCITAFGGDVDRDFTCEGMRPVSGSGFTASYDGFGNMRQKTLDGTAWAYTWTVDNRLAAVSRDGALAATMTYAADGRRVKKVYAQNTGPTVTTYYVGDVYERRKYSDATPERHTLYLHGNGQLVASVTRAGAITTAWNNPTQWRNEWAQLGLYDGASAVGAVKKTGHFIAAVSAHPVVVRWGALTVFGLLGVCLVVVFIRARPAWTAPRGFAPRLRFAALPLVVGFTFTACFAPNEDPRLNAARIMSGDTRMGPALGTFYFHRNHINSSSVITDPSGNVITRMVYWPFGEIAQGHSWGNDAVTSKFTGQEHDAETGLYYYGARYYDAAIGRFVSADSVVPSITDSQAFNPYAYARNNPLVYTDPTGHSFWSTVAGIFNAIGNAIGSAFRGLVRAAVWIGDRYADAWKFWIKGHVFAARIAYSMVVACDGNPLAAIGLFLAIAAGPPGWVGLAAAIVAQGMAMAAGITDPTALALIGAVAGAAAGGIAAAVRSCARFGAERALVAAGVPEALVVAATMAEGLVNLRPQPPPDGACAGPACGTPAAGEERTTLIRAQDEAMQLPEHQYGYEGSSHCNQGTRYVGEQMGAPMGPLNSGKGRANDIAAALATSKEYRVVSPDEAQQLANQGRFVVGAASVPGGTGHVSTVRPQLVMGDSFSGGTGPLIANIGKSVGVMRQTRAFGALEVRYYTPVAP